MSSTNSKRVGAPHRYRKWMSAATAAALVAGSATMTLAAPRGAVRADRMQARAVSFQWQAFTPRHIVHIDTPASQGPLGNMNTDALHAPAAGFAWQMFTPKHIVTKIDYDPNSGKISGEFKQPVESRTQFSSAGPNNRSREPRIRRGPLSTDFRPATALPGSRTAFDHPSSVPTGRVSPTHPKGMMQPKAAVIGPTRPRFPPPALTMYVPGRSP